MEMILIFTRGIVPVLYYYLFRRARLSLAYNNSWRRYPVVVGATPPGQPRNALPREWAMPPHAPPEAAGRFVPDMAGVCVALQGVLPRRVGEQAFVRCGSAPARGLVVLSV